MDSEGAEELRDPSEAGIPAYAEGSTVILGLNYYHRFIPAFAVYDNALYSLTARDFEQRISNPETRDLERWTHAQRAFGTLRSKIATTPMLKHFDTDKQPVVIVFASDWAVTAVLTQDEGFPPVKFTSWMLKPNELNYSIAEKEILALLPVLNEREDDSRLNPTHDARLALPL
ncbi:LOW QUALITY PROTEIN: reverse transcriptase [Phytophthora megakarya]|uniref:Reverse transcriptase n=1 Tax=Phytophthora megakarya TaxID=4795 RepID=A0A225WXA1_9STRA|nr:LOW QUALITY PROTEIN: reverse transcriptase [Phytophthora megakarya]